MKWGDLKKIVEAQGVKDDTNITYIDIDVTLSFEQPIVSKNDLGDTYIISG